MKKRKELLWFLIPFVFLPIVSAIGTYFSWMDTTSQVIFIGKEQYLELLWKDPAFWMGIINGLVSYWLISAVLALVLGLAVRWLSLSRSMKYVVIFTTATVITAAVWMIGMRLMPQWYNLLNFVKYGNAAAFFAWLAECLWTTVKKPKQECETQ